MSQSDSKIALLIDADNAPANKIDAILSELAKYGVANVRRAYGNWKSPSLKAWEEALHEYAIRPIQQFDYSKGKNATDIALVIDAMDLLYTQKLDAFCIVSSDSDFTPLIMRILTNGLKVYGFGEKKTPEPFVNACSIFTYLEALELAKEEIEPKPQVPAQSLPSISTVLTNSSPVIQKPTIKSDTKLMNLLRSAIDATVTENGWSMMGAVGGHISNQASFDCRNYGYKKLSDLFQACDLFDTAKNQKGILMVRRRQKKLGTVPAPTVLVTNLAAATYSQKTPSALDDALKEKYTQILKAKGWEVIYKFSLMNYYRVMKNVPCCNKQKLISHVLGIRSTATESDAKKAFNIFWKAKLFKVETDSVEEKRIELIDYPDFLERIDSELLSRLIAGCKEQNIAIDSSVVAIILYSSYEKILLESKITMLVNNFYSTACAVVGED